MVDGRLSLMSTGTALIDSGEGIDVESMMRTEPKSSGPMSRVPMNDAELLAALDRGFDHKRESEARLVGLAAELVERSRPSLGNEGLAARAGATGPAALLVELGRITIAEAQRLCRVAEATADRMSLIGERLPAEYPLVADAVRAARIPIDSANAIVAALAQASPRAEPQHLSAAESALVEFAIDNPADLVRRLAIRWRDALDVDGVEPREEQLIARRALHRTVLANGMKRYRLDLDPAGAAFLDAAIDAQVGAAIRVPRFDGPDAGHPFAGDSGAGDEALPDPRTLPQMAADAVVDLARHGIVCTDATVPLPSATIVVRMTIESLRTGVGAASIDGSMQPISATTARRMAADAHLIPMVLGGAGEVLDIGVSRRLFSRAQRIALAERDGGCAWVGCPRPPSHTEAHHIEWWSRGGETNLSNGVLLCSRHHHVVHAHGWGIEVIDNVPWFIPPSSADVYRVPRRGGRLDAVPELSSWPHPPVQR